MVAGPAGVLGLWKAVEWLVSSRVRRGEAAEAQAEEVRDKKLDEVLSVVQRMEKELAVSSAEARRQAVAIGNAEARIDGISTNHGARMSALEQRMAVLDEAMKELKARRRR
jgi:hypothetical protein